MRREAHCPTITNLYETVYLVSRHLANCTTTMLGDAEYLTQLEKKLSEEWNEYLTSKTCAPKSKNWQISSR